MDLDSDSQPAALSNADEWLACFSPVAGSKPGAFPFTSHKIHSIESRRARMSDLLLFDVLLIRGGIRNPDMLFPPPDWSSLRKLLDAIDQSVYDILKKDCLVYILLKWAWDIDSKETNTGWESRYIQDRCIAPQFVALADAYWLLDTGTHLAKAVSILSDARLNRDYVSKILQALALSSSPTSFANGTAHATATLVANYVRTAKPLLTEPDDIDLYALSLAQLSFMDAWAYQKSFPEGSDTRERLLGKIIAWSLMPTPKQGPLMQLVAFPLSSYEQSALHSLAVPSQFPPSSSLSSANAHPTTTNPVLSSQAIAILQDLLCVRAIQSGDYVRAIKLDRQFSSMSPPSLGNLPSSSSSNSIASQANLSSRDAIDRKSIIQDLFATLPPAERTLLEDEIGKVATGVRTTGPSTFTPKQGASSAPARRPFTTEPGLSASWEDVRATRSPAPHPPTSTTSDAPIGTGFASKTVPVPASVTTRVQPSSPSPFPVSPFASHVLRPQPNPPVSPKPKFTAFGLPLTKDAGTRATRVPSSSIVERAKTLFSGAATTNLASAAPAKSGPTRASLFAMSGSAKHAPNAFYNPSASALPANKGSGMLSSSVGAASGLPGSSTATFAVAAKSPGRQTSTATKHGQNGEAKAVDGGEDVKMGSGSDVEIVEEEHELVGEEEEAEAEDEERDAEGEVDKDEETENFITHDKSDAADLTFRPPQRVDDAMSEDDGAGVPLRFSVFSSGSGKHAVQSAGVVEHGKNGNKKSDANGNGHRLHTSISPPSHQGETSVSLNTSTSRRHALPGTFHHEDEEEEQPAREHEREVEEKDADDRTPLVDTSRRRQSMRARTPQEPQEAETRPSRPSAHRLPERTRKSAPEPMSMRRHPPIPGALMDDDVDHHGDDEDAEMDEREDEEEQDEEEEEAVAPLPSRASRRTRSMGYVAVPSLSSAATAGKSKKKTATTTKGRPSEPMTPARRSSRLSMASSVSPDHLSSPTKKGRKSVVARASVADGETVLAATRSSTRRKR